MTQLIKSFSLTKLLKIFPMKRLFTFLCFMMIGLVGTQAQIIFQEDFEGGGVPTDWTIESSATDGGWNIGTSAALSSQNFAIASNGTSGIAATNDDSCNCDKSDEYFITPAIDLSGQAGFVLSVDVFYGNQNYSGVPEDATIEISLDGTTWTVLEDLHGHGSWDKHTVNLSDYAGESAV